MTITQHHEFAISPHHCHDCFCLLWRANPSFHITSRSHSILLTAIAAPGWFRRSMSSTRRLPPRIASGCFHGGGEVGVNNWQWLSEFIGVDSSRYAWWLMMAKDCSTDDGASWPMMADKSYIISKISHSDIWWLANAMEVPPMAGMMGVAPGGWGYEDNERHMASGSWNSPVQMDFIDAKNTNWLHNQLHYDG